MQNLQPAEKQTKDFHTLQVHSVFHTIQGEGPFCGTPAVFIRLAGCNLQCPFCDTDYTSQRQEMTIVALVELVQTKAMSGLVVITGGEPFRQDISFLVDTLLRCKYYVQVETNGTLAPSPDIVWKKSIHKREGAYIVCAPKTSKVNRKIAELACAAKYVVKHDQVAEDGLPTQVLNHPCNDVVARLNKWVPVTYVQPCDVKDAAQNDKNLQTAIQSCMKHGYVLQLQVHKLINME